MDPRVALVLWAAFAFACGGQSESNDAPGSGGAGSGATGGAGTGGAGTGGTGTGGTGTGGASTGGAGTGGAGTGGLGTGGMPICCGAFPACDAGEVEVTVEDCVPPTTCRQVSICCSTILCASVPTCDGLPVCDEGDTPLPPTCPPELYCYERERCGAVITCRDDFCDPESEHNRSYVGESPERCAVIDFGCTGETSYFYNDCGCGCEQDASCPESVDCSPAAQPNPYCNGEGVDLCPLSPRLQ